MEEDRLVTRVTHQELNLTMIHTTPEILPENRDIIGGSDMNPDHIDVSDAIQLQVLMIHHMNHRIEATVQDRTSLIGLQTRATYHLGYNTNGNNTLKLNGSNTLDGNNMFNGKINSIRHRSLYHGVNRM